MNSNKFLVALFVFLLGFQTLAFASPQAESDYRWNYLDLKTRFSTQISGSSSSYQGTGSGYISSHDVESWYVTKGGRSITEGQYLRLLGDNGKADEIEGNINTINTINITSWVVSGAALVYMFVDILDGNDKYTGAIVGSVVALVAAFYPLFNQPPTHYLQYEEVGPQIDGYNKQLKLKLGLPENYRP